jgi:hypothetical protein
MLRRAEGLWGPSKPRTPETSAVYSETHGAEHFSMQRQSGAPLTTITTVEPLDLCWIAATVVEMVEMVEEV